MNEDLQLLRDYVERGNESAFASIVEKYLKLVYATAVRQVEDPEAAKDVTQSVFCLLAEKAGQLRSGTVLVGWLYQTTCFKASCYKRAEFRRALREREGGMMLQNESNAGEGTWTEIAPHLDEALNALRSEDRLVILLRFFQKKPLREVGRELGIGEDAARMRVQRVVEKLRDLLGRKEVVCSAVALAAILSEQVADAAPAITAQAVTKAALTMSKAVGASSVLGLWLSRLLAVKGQVAAVGGAMLLVAGGYYYFQSAPHATADKLLAASSTNDLATNRNSGNALVQRLRASNATSDGSGKMSPKDVRAAREHLRDLLFAAIDEKGYPSYELSLAVNAFAPEFELAVPTLIDALKSDRELVRKRAACLLDNLDHYLQKGAYSNFKQPVAFIAFDTQPLRMALRDVVPTIREAMFSSKDVTTRQRLIDVVAVAAPSPESLEDIVTAIRKDPRNASSIVLMGRHAFVEQPEAAGEILIPLLKDPLPELRWCAAYCLAALPGEKSMEALPILVNTLNDSSNDLMAIEAIKLYGADAKPWFDQIISKKVRGAQAKKRFFETLEVIDPEGAKQLPEFQQWLQQQEQTEVAKNRVDRPDVSVDELISDLAVRETRYIALDRLAKMGPAASAALPALRRELTNYTFAEGKEIIGGVIKQIDPDSPKPCFAHSEVMPAIKSVTKWSEQAMPQIHDAIVSEVNREIDYSPEDLAKLAAKLEAIHPHCRELFVAQMLEKDSTLSQILNAKGTSSNQ